MIIFALVVVFSISVLIGTISTKSGLVTDIVWMVDCNNKFALISFLKRLDVIVVTLSFGNIGTDTFGTIPIFV